MRPSGPCRPRGRALPAGSPGASRRRWRRAAVSPWASRSSSACPGRRRRRGPPHDAGHGAGRGHLPGLAGGRPRPGRRGEPGQLTNFDPGSRIVLPFLWQAWIGRLDVLVLTHAQSDHASGIPAILRNLPVGEVWTGEEPAESPTALWLQEFLRHRRIPHRVVATDTPARFGEAGLEVLHPAPLVGEWDRGVAPRRSRSNAQSLVIRVRLGGQAILLAGDVARAAGGGRARPGGAGDPGATPQGPASRLTRRQQPRAAGGGVAGPAWPSCRSATGNPFRHPHPETLARYAERKIQLLRTDRQGAITVDMGAEGIRASGRRAE